MLKNLFKKKTVKIPANIIQSCEDKSVVYAELKDGLRLIFRNKEYDGWYFPGESDNHPE